MKIITFVVPCYNSAAYMDRCIETLLPGGDDIEIILVNDGSTDETPLICDRYAAENPGVVKAVHQENGGHGEGINQGLKNAGGLYIKVVDSDDWLDIEALQSLLNQLRQLAKMERPVDLVMCNYIYDHALDNVARVMSYTNALPQNRVFSWQDCGRVRVSQYYLMHALVYRTQLLKDCGFILPKHTFYVDNLYAYAPFPYVKTIFYMNLDLYHYFIGREDQSVNEQIMAKRVAQQVRVTKLMLDSHDLRKVSPPKLAKYMSHYMSMMISISSVMLILNGSPESEALERDMWQYLKEHDKGLYYRFKYFSLSFLLNLDKGIGHKFSMGIYRLAKKIFHFN